jgi:hypothetical protein
MTTMNEARGICEAAGMGHVRVVLGEAGPGCGFADRPTQTIVIGHERDLFAFRGLTIHELSHLASQRPLNNSPALDLNHCERTLAALSTHRPVAIDDSKLEPWLWHDLKFIRTALHVHYRASAAGYECSWRHARIGGAPYGLSEAWLYGGALGCEPRRLADVPLWEISDTPMPCEFIRLFESDVLSFRKGEK